MHARYADFDTAYKSILQDVCTNGKPVSPRGVPCRELLAYTWELTDLTRHRVNFLTTQASERQAVYDCYCEAELKWYLSGDLHAASAPSKFWLKLANGQGEVTSNYGSLILHQRHYPGDLTAYEHALNLLQADPSTRQAILHYSQPVHYARNPKDVPCTLTAQLLLREDRLLMVVSQRSCDLIKGLPYDVAWHAWLQQQLASALKVQAGSLVHAIGSVHLYDRDGQLAQQILTQV